MSAENIETNGKDDSERMLYSVSLGDPKPIQSPFFGSCRQVESFEKIKRIGEGTYGVVYCAKDTLNGSLVAMKRLRMEHEHEGLPVSSLREIALLKKLRHENVVRVVDVVVGKSLSETFNLRSNIHGYFGIIFSHGDLATLMDTVIIQMPPRKFFPDECFLFHPRRFENWFCLFTSADFGLARTFSIPPSPMTPRVVTLWYRSPEILLGDTNYTISSDTWALGCIFGELLKSAPLLPGKSEPHQLDLICALIGSPNESIWPNFSRLPYSSMLRSMQSFSTISKTFNDGASYYSIELIKDLLVYDPSRRISVKAALRHGYFLKEGPTPCPPHRIRLRLDTGYAVSQVSTRRQLEQEQDEESRRLKSYARNECDEI